MMQKHEENNWQLYKNKQCIIGILHHTITNPYVNNIFAWFAVNSYNYPANGIIFGEKRTMDMKYMSFYCL